MIVKSFVEMAKFLLAKDHGTDPDLFLLSERISQDPLENYFGQQRARAERNENPNSSQCLSNAAAKGIQKSMPLIRYVETVTENRDHRLYQQ